MRITHDRSRVRPGWIATGTRVDWIPETAEGENDSLQHTEHGAVRSDAERERKQCDNREAGIADQRTDTITNILEQCPFQRLRCGGVVRPFLRLHIVPF